MFSCCKKALKVELRIPTQDQSVWTVAQAKARLSELLRLANENPQYIGTKKPYVVVPLMQWQALNPSPEPFGQWLVGHLAGVDELTLPDRADPGREIPFQ